MSYKILPILLIIFVATVAITLQVVIWNGPDTHGLLTLPHE